MSRRTDEHRRRDHSICNDNKICTRRGECRCWIVPKITLKFFILLIVGITTLDRVMILRTFVNAFRGTVFFSWKNHHRHHHQLGQVGWLSSSSSSPTTKNIHRLFSFATSSSSSSPGGGVDASIISQSTVGYEKIFDVHLPEGRCVGVRINHLIALDADSSSSSSSSSFNTTATSSTNTSTTAVFAPWVYEVLHPLEVQYAGQIPSETTRKSFVGGRLALRQAMECQIHDCVILKDTYGRPNIPPSFRGSISHKGDVAVAMVAPTTAEGETDWAIGVDLEVRQKGHSRIGSRILTKSEQNNLGLVDGICAEEEVLLRFSVKEALYKAMHPLICHYVGFQEAEVRPSNNGAVNVRLNLNSGAHEDFASVTAHWKALDNYFLTSARVQLKLGVHPRTPEPNDECTM